MKSRYFTDETIREKSLEMLRKFRGAGENFRIPFKPEPSALLILDMQDYFLDEASHAFIPGAQAILPNIQSLAAAYNEINAPVFVTRHLNTDADAGLMSLWWKDVITANDKRSLITTELDLPYAIVVEKTQYDGFYKTPLEDMLRKKEVSQIVITGVMAHLCCETTARSAFVRGFAVYFAVDGTASYNENFHLAALTGLSHGFAVPVLTRELLDEMGKQSGD